MGSRGSRVRKCHLPPLCVVWWSQSWRLKIRRWGRHTLSLGSLTCKGEIGGGEMENGDSKVEGEGCVCAESGLDSTLPAAQLELVSH